MKNNYEISKNKQQSVSRLAFDKILFGTFAALSLAFALFYTFGQNATTHAGVVFSTVGAPKTSDDNAAPEAAAATVSDVVTKALAFKNSLTTAQQATLQQTYTASLARKWSNLPCGSSCRNGIQFSTLTSAQLTAALAVIQAAMGTTANEGSDEFNQVRAADAYLGANGGGSGYSDGIYFISFLNTPSTTGAWMLQFGGHHYAANISYNNGHVVGTTPHFYGLEPLTFTSNGTTYAPLMQERDAMANMLASLSATQLASAKLSQTFSDLTMSPGETNGGNGTFPATKVGIAVSTLSDAQKLLVLEAMKPWVKDMDDTVAANLLRIYQNELSGTYIAYTGNGTAGDASSFLNANTNYARIDGPSVWVEFICQTGAVFRNNIHYHTIWRDHVRDYAADLSLTTALDTTASKTKFDYDGDGKADVSVYRPSEGNWFLQKSGSSNAFAATQFGASGDNIVPADYDGDGKTDVAVYRSGNWYILRSADNAFAAVQFGVASDVPVPGDYDADGKADQAVYRSGTWYLNRSTAGFTSVQFGLSTDKTVPADYDADGKTDVAVYRDGTWYTILSATNAFSATQFGVASDTPVPADYDADGKADQAVYRAGIWYLNRSTSGFTAVQFGNSTDAPVPADFDGDGKTDQAVYRSGVWYILPSLTSQFYGTQFGVASDTPTLAAYIR